AGYAPAIDFLRTRLVEHKSRGTIVMPAPLPTEIAAYDQWLTHFGEPRRVGGPVKMAHFLRDLGIAMAVKITLCQFPQIKRRSSSAHIKGAYRLVSEIIGEPKVGNIGESDVRKVYESLEPYLPSNELLETILGKSSSF